jgi:hypothetical protein
MRPLLIFTREPSQSGMHEGLLCDDPAALSARALSARQLNNLTHAGRLPISLR